MAGCVGVHARLVLRRSKVLLTSADRVGGALRHHYDVGVGTNDGGHQ